MTDNFLSRQSIMSGMSQQSLSIARVLCHDYLRALNRARILVALLHTRMSCKRPRVLVPAHCIVLSRHNFCVTTQGLPALTTPCCDTSHGLDTGLKGLCYDRENLCNDPSHPVPAPNPVATPKFSRNTRPSNLCRDREFSIATEELWAFCRNRDFLSRQAFYLVTPACTRSLASTRACRAHCSAILLRHGGPGRDT